MPVHIPEDVKKKIDNETEKFRPIIEYKPWQDNIGYDPVYNEIKNKVEYERQIFKTGSEFGYSLSQQQLEEKDKEIDRLKGWYEKMQHDFNKMFEYSLKKSTKEEIESATKYLKEILQNNP